MLLLPGEGWGQGKQQAQHQGKGPLLCGHGILHPKARDPLTSFTMDLMSLLASCRSSGFLLFNNLAKSWKRRVSEVEEQATPHLGRTQDRSSPQH